MSPTTWRDARKVAGLVLGRLGNLDRRVLGGIDRHHAAPTAQQTDLPGSPLGQIDDGAAAPHAVVDENHDGLPGVAHGYPHAGAERDTAAGGGQTLLIEDLAGAGAEPVMPSAIPRRDADRLSECKAREQSGNREDGEKRAGS
jgi:hypothetical protein